MTQAATAARRLVDKGFVEMKTQMALPGNPSPAEEVRRVRVVRDAIGPDIKLMCDINQRWRVEQAIDIGHRVADVGLFWLEDVTTCDDYAGLARVNAALSTPIAGGEYVWGIVPFRHMIEARSVDYVMIDLCRVGGVTQWMKVAGMAEAFNLPVVSHVVPEMHLHLIAAVPERTDGGIHALDAEALRGDAGDREGPAGAAEQARAGAEVRRKGGGGVSGGLTEQPKAPCNLSYPGSDQADLDGHFSCSGFRENRPDRVQGGSQGLEPLHPCSSAGREDHPDFATHRCVNKV